MFTALIGCDGAAEPPPRPDPDLGRQCHPPGQDAGAWDAGLPGCRVGEICIEGRCYESCSSDRDCGPREMCSPSGACVRGTRDAGTPDSGPVDMCRGVSCTAPQVCEPRTGTCVDCTEGTVGAAPGEPGRCSAFNPICDIANGRCHALGPAQCTPCNTSEECNAPDGSFTGTCVLRETLGVREQTCVPPCAEGACPDGLVCSTVRDLVTDTDVTGCVPPIEMPCTNWLAAIAGVSCLEDSDCAPLGATRAVYPGACAGADPTADPVVMGTCLQPCGETEHCFNAPLGAQCIGSGVALFCRFE